MTEPLDRAALAAQARRALLWPDAGDVPDLANAVLAMEREWAQCESFLQSLRTELWEGVREHGLFAPPSASATTENQRLIHAYCGGIVLAREERDAERVRGDRYEAALRGIAARGCERSNGLLSCLGRIDAGAQFVDPCGVCCARAELKERP